MEDSQRQPASLLHWGLVSQYRSQLFGFAILWIMCMHSREFTPIPDNPLLSQSLLYDGIILVGAAWAWICFCSSPASGCTTP